MASGQFAVVYRQIGRLFQSGSVTGLSEGQLLDRFVARRDDDAFEAIVARHGPMVLGVCRAVLHDPHDVEDAFQATFLVLVKKADALRDRDLLGNWLYGVAHRVARRARNDAARRRVRESSGPKPADRSRDDSDVLDVRPMIHEEVNRLPESYRVAVVLCYLEGRTHEEAARELGWPIGTVKGRLARAKDLLRDRLARRGLAVPAGALVVSLAREGQAVVGPTLLHATTTAATSVVTASALAVSPHVLALVQGVLQVMSTAKLKLAAILVVAGFLSASGVSAYQEGLPASNPGGPAVVKTDVAKATVAPAESSQAEARLKLAEEAYAIIRDSRRSGGMGEPDLKWPQRLKAAKAEFEEEKKKAEGPAYVYNTAVRDLAKAREIETRLLLLKQANSDKVGSVQPPELPLDLLDAQYRRIEAEERLARLNKAPREPQAAAAEGPKVELDGRLHPRPNKENPADVDRNKRIEEALEKVVTMNFPDDTPLEDVLKYVKENTKDAKGRPIPIYLDRAGFEQADKTSASTVSIDIDSLPLRTTLRLVLKQLDLEYRVRLGLLYISSSDTFDEEEGIAPPPSNVQGGGLQ